jgi:hypothetical protein
MTLSCTEPSREERLRRIILVAMLSIGTLLPVAAQGKPAEPAKVITSVTATVNPPSYQGGPCPARFTFVGTIVADKTPTGPITYQWVHSDTSIKHPVRSLTMTGKGAIVMDSLSVGLSGEMMRVWAELRVLTPNPVTSAKVYAAVLCR